jgi:arylsulfatase A-like enzyme
MPQEFIEQYDTDKIDLPPNFAPIHPFDNGELDIRDEWLAGYPRTQEEIKANIVAYYAMITHMDLQIGKIISALEEKGLRENTIIVFTSDNGLAVGQHGLMGKQNLYEHSIKIPLIFQGPGIPQGMSDPQLVYTTDLFPTLCDLTGTSKPEDLDGISLINSFKNKKGKERSSLIFAYKNSQRAIRKGEFKLIEYLVNGQKTGQLFHLKSDPWETKNLYKLDAYKSKKSALQIELQKQLTTYNDPVILSSEDWGVKAIPSWINKVSPSTIESLRALAIKDRKLRGFYDSTKHLKK